MSAIRESAYTYESRISIHIERTDVERDESIVESTVHNIVVIYGPETWKEDSLVQSDTHALRDCWRHDLSVTAY